MLKSLCDMSLYDLNRTEQETRNITNVLLYSIQVFLCTQFSTSWCLRVKMIRELLYGPPFCLLLGNEALLAFALATKGSLDLRRLSAHWSLASSPPSPSWDRSAPRVKAVPTELTRCLCVVLPFCELYQYSVLLFAFTWLAEQLSGIRCRS